MKKYTKKKSEKYNKYRKSKKSNKITNPKKSNKSRKTFYLQGGGKKEYVQQLKQQLDSFYSQLDVIKKRIEAHKQNTTMDKDQLEKIISGWEYKIEQYTKMISEKEYIYNILKKEVEEEEKEELRGRQIAAAVAKAKADRYKISEDAKERQDLRVAEARAKTQSPATVDEITELERKIKEYEEDIKNQEETLKEINNRIFNETTDPEEVKGYEELYNDLKKNINGLKLKYNMLLAEHATLEMKKKETEKKLQKSKAKQDKAKASSNPDEDAEAKKNADLYQAQLLAEIEAEEIAKKKEEDKKTDKKKKSKEKEAAEKKAKEDAAAEKKAKEAADKKAKEDAAAEKKAKEDAEKKAKEDAAAEKKAKEAAEKKAKEDAAAEKKAKKDAKKKAKEDAAAAAQEEEELQRALAESLQKKTPLAAQSSSRQLEQQENLIARMQEDFQKFLTEQYDRYSNIDGNEEVRAHLAEQIRSEFNKFIRSQYEILSQSIEDDVLGQIIEQMQKQFEDFLMNIIIRPSGIKAPPRTSSLNRDALVFTPKQRGLVPFQIPYKGPFLGFWQHHDPYASYNEYYSRIPSEVLKQQVLENERIIQEEQQKRIEEARRSGQYHKTDKDDMYKEEKTKKRGDK
jgi:hypothetical protein